MSAGNLDPTFGVGGEVLTPIGSYALANAMTVQPDGKIIAAGYSSTGYSNAIELVRYNPDGSLDASFGNAGLVTIGQSGDYRAYAVALQADGKIIVAGTHESRNFLVARLNGADGSLDTTFGIGGEQTIYFAAFSPPFAPQGYATAQSVALQANGNILVAGWAQTPNPQVPWNFDNSFAVARLNGADGSLDTTFGTGGKETIAVGPESGATSVAVQPNGQIIVSGDSYHFQSFFPGSYQTTGFHMAAVRLNGTDGSLDASFGNAGQQIIDFGYGTQGTSMALQADGKIVMAGSGTPNPQNGSDMAVTRLNGSDGSLDSSFGTGGIENLGFTGTFAAGAAVQNDGKIVLGGDLNHFYSAFALARLNSDGTGDTSLGPNGQVLTNFGLASTGLSVALQSDGKILMAGYSVPTPGAAEFAVARYRPVGPPSATSQSLAAFENTPTSITLNSTDPNGDPLTFSVTNPTNGTLSGSGPNLVYTPNAGFNGTDSFQFNVTDTVTGLVSDPATENITVYAPVQIQIQGMPASSPEGSQIFLTASETIPNTGPALTVLSVAWNVTKNGAAFGSPGTDFNYYFTPDDSGDYVVTLTATESLGGVVTVQESVNVTDVAPAAAISYQLPFDATFNPTAPVGTLITFGGSFSDNPVESRALTNADAVSWSVTLNGQPYSLPASTITNGPSFSFTPTAVGTYVVSLIVADPDGGSVSVQQTLDITSMDANSLQNVLNLEAYLANQNFNGGPPTPVALTLQADPTQINAAVAALNSIVQPQIYDNNNLVNVTVAVAVNLNLTSGNYSDLNFSLQPPVSDPNTGALAYVTVIVNGVNGSTTVVGHSPALTVTSGNVAVNNVIFTTATDSPTILVTGGSLALRNDVVQESTGYADAAISITSGTIDLGSIGNPGNNIINVNGSGRLVQASGPGLVSAAGDTSRPMGRQSARSRAPR